MSSRWSLSTSFFANRHALSQLHMIDVYSEDEYHCLEKLKIVNYMPAMLCWIEKFLLIIDYFQIFGLLWNASQPWPWPSQWISLTEDLNYINLDFFSMSSEGALRGSTNLYTKSTWGQMDGYLNYALSFAIISFILMTFFAILSSPREYYGQAPYRYRIHILGAVGLVIYFSYLPTLLAVFRLYYCETQSAGVFVLSADPNITCGSISHIVVLIVSTGMICPLLFGLPYLLYTYITNNLLYLDPHDHEKRTQIWELLYLLGLDDYWMEGKVWLMASTNRFGAYFWLHMMTLKFLLLITFIFVRNSFIGQSCTMMTMIILFAGYYSVVHLPFRSLSSNMILACIFIMLIFEIVFGMANSSGARNAVLVASTETLFLAACNMGCFVIIFIIFFQISFFQTVFDWPAIRTLHRIYHNRDLLPKVATWIETMRESYHIRDDFLLAPVEIADVKALEDIIRRLRQSWLQARSCGSIFESALSDTLQELILIHSSRIAFALRKHDHWDEAYITASNDQVFSKRHERTYLMSTRKRKILTKLLSYRFVRGDRGKFDINVTLEYERNLKFQDELRKKRRESQLQLASNAASSPRRKSSFGVFQKNAREMLSLGGNSIARINEENDENDEENPLLGRAGGIRSAMTSPRSGADGMVASGLPSKKKFDPMHCDEAAKMIARLQERTEKTLHKHHEAAKTFKEQQRQAMMQSKLPVGSHLNLQALKQQRQQGGTGSEGSTPPRSARLTGRLSARLSARLSPREGSVLQSSTSGTTAAGGAPRSLSSIQINSLTNVPPHLQNHNSSMQGLNKISTMELIKQNVDEEEIQDLEDLFHLWDEAIYLYEEETFPGDYLQLSEQVENWYAYRGLVSQKLELMINTLNEQMSLLEELADQNVSVVDYDYDEEGQQQQGGGGGDDDDDNQSGVSGLVSKH